MYNPGTLYLDKGEQNAMLILWVHFPACIRERAGISRPLGLSDCLEKLDKERKKVTKRAVPNQAHHSCPSRVEKAL